MWMDNKFGKVDKMKKEFSNFDEFKNLDKDKREKIVKNIYENLIDNKEENHIDNQVYFSWENKDYKIEWEYDWWNEWDGNYGYSISLITFKKENFDVYVRFNWTYSSWNDCEWYNFDIVEPKKVIEEKYLKYDDNPSNLYIEEKESNK